MQNIFAHKEEGSLLPEHTQDLSCTKTRQEAKTFKTRKLKGQDTTKITSAPAESCIQFPWSVYLCLALVNMLLAVVHHSSSLVFMVVPMPH